MSRSRVSIAFDHESLERFERLVGRGSLALGAHCGDDDDGDDGDGGGCFSGAIASGAHCGDDDDGDDDGGMTRKLACLVV